MLTFWVKLQTFCAVYQEETLYSETAWHLPALHTLSVCCCVSDLQLPPGTGPFGTYTPADVAQLQAKAQATLAATGPQLQQLVQQPGAVQLLQDVSRQLAQRFAARVIKFAFAGSQAATSSASL